MTPPTQQTRSQPGRKSMSGGNVCAGLIHKYKYTTMEETSLQDTTVLKIHKKVVQEWRRASDIGTL